MFNNPSTQIYSGNKEIKQNKIIHLTLPSNLPNNFQLIYQSVTYSQYALAERLQLLTQYKAMIGNIFSTMAKVFSF